MRSEITLNHCPGDGHGDFNDGDSARMETASAAKPRVFQRKILRMAGIMPISSMRARTSLLFIDASFRTQPVLNSHEAIKTSATSYYASSSLISLLIFVSWASRIPTFGCPGVLRMRSTIILKINVAFPHELVSSTICG